MATFTNRPCAPNYDEIDRRGSLRRRSQFCARCRRPPTKRERKRQSIISLASGCSCSPATRGEIQSCQSTGVAKSAVQEARDRRNKADDEYRALLHAEMLKIDSSLKRVLDKVGEVKAFRDY